MIGTVMVTTAAVVVLSCRYELLLAESLAAAVG
jgi:hypothetical protein